MTAPTTTSAPLPDATRQRILAAFYRDEKNTHEIATALDLPECVVAEVVRADREARARGNGEGHR